MTFEELKNKCEKFVVHPQDDEGPTGFKEQIIERLYRDMHKGEDMDKFVHEVFERHTGYAIVVPVSEDKDPNTIPMNITMLDKEN